MSFEFSNTSADEPGPSRKESQLSVLVTTSIATGTQEDKEYMSSLSQKSSPRLPSILLSSPKNDTKPRSSEGRVSTLSLPKQPSQPPRQNTMNHPSSLGQSRRRVLSHTNAIRNDREVNVSGKGYVQLDDDGLPNFGIGDGYTLEPDDPEVLADIQKALKAKYLREAAVKSGTSSPKSSSSPTKAGPSDTQLPPEPSTLVPLSSLPSTITPPRVLVSESIHTRTPFSAPPQRIAFPPYAHSSLRSRESTSSEDLTRRSPIPILVPLPDGSSYLDWSGAPPDIPLQKDRTSLRRKFSITRHKGKVKAHNGGMTGRHSVDLEASQGNLHTAQLDSIRRAAKRETLSRAEITKEELGRRYRALIPHKPTGEPALAILEVIKSRPEEYTVHTPWLAWARQRIVSRRKVSIWTITASTVEDFLQKSGQSSIHSHPPTPANILVPRSHSPSYRFSSSFLSSRSSVSISPVRSDGARKRTELNRSFSANPVIEGIASSSPPRTPLLSRSLSMTQAPTSRNLAQPPTAHSRRSIDAMLGSNSATVSSTNINRSPRSSLDPGSRPQSTRAKTDKDSLRKRVRLSLSGDRSSSAVPLRPSTMSSLTNLFGATQTSGGRLHLGVSNMFGIGRRDGKESGGRPERSRSSVSDEHESGREGEETKSDEPGAPRKTGKALMPIVEFHGLRSRGKDTLNTSDSDLGGSGGGHLGNKLALRFHKSEKDRDRERYVENAADDVQESFSGGERRLVDTLATPGWTSKSGVRRARISVPREIDQEKLQEMLRLQEEAEERSREMYKAREVMLIEANDHNRRIARLLKAVGTSIREHESVQLELMKVVGAQYVGIPQDVLEAIAADPATTLRHGKGWRAVEHSHHRFITQQALLASYLSTREATPEQDCSSDLANLIQEAGRLWHDLRLKNEEIDQRSEEVQPVLEIATTRMEQLQREYNDTHILVETDYPEQNRIAELETIITESRSPRGWLEFAAFWIPELVLEIIGGFIRFFGVPISEKFIRPFLWYFFRNRYYWKIYSTEPPPSSRAWYTRLGYWVIILSILAWYTTG